MLLSQPDVDAIAINDIVIYKQISLCVKDASVTKVPILKKAAEISLAILEAARKIKFHKIEFQQLAHHAADLIVEIWHSYRKAEAPETWLSPLLRCVLQGLLENLESMLVFFEGEASTNILIRMLSRSIDIRRINRHHERLGITLNKIEIQSNIAANNMLLEVLEEQKQLSDQIQHENEVQEVEKRVADSASRVNKNKGPSRKVYTVSATLNANYVARSGKARITKKAVKKTARKTSLSSEVDEFSDDEEVSEDELLSSTTETRSAIHNFIIPSASIGNWPWTMDQSNGTTTLSLPSCSSITISGRGVIVNHQGIRNVAASSNFTNARIERSVNNSYYHL